MPTPNSNPLAPPEGERGDSGTIIGTVADFRQVSAALSRDWPISPALRAKVVREAERIIDAPDSTYFHRLSAIRSLALLDGRNIQRERNGIDQRQGDAMISLQAVRTQLAAQLAADPTALSRLSGGLTVAPALPAPPLSLSGSGKTTPSPPVLPPVQCKRCEDAGVLVTSRGTISCPVCSSHDSADPADLAY